jgi:hypothetical protein
MQTCDPADIDSVCVTIAGVDASIRAPRSVLSILDRTLAHARRTPARASIRAAIEVEGDELAWRISGNSQRSIKVLSATSALPRVGGAVVSSVIADVAEAARLSVCRAAVVERDGRAIAFVGDDWESGVVLAAHLHARGWRLLGGDYALIDRATLTVLGSRKLLHVTLSVLDELPVTYRRAVEASPWYSTPHDIAFYAVDPALARSTSPWAEAGRLCAVLALNGDVSEFPSIERTNFFALGDGMDSDALERAGVAVAEVRLGDYVSTCDLVQRWFQALVTG